MRKAGFWTLNRIIPPRSGKGFFGRRFLNLFVPAFLMLCVNVHAVDPVEQAQLADGLYARGMYDMALNEYLMISRQAPDYENMDRVLFRIAECHRRLGRPVIADRFYLRLMREQSESEYRHRAGFRRAELRIVSEQYEDAVGLLAELLDNEPTDEIAASALFYSGYSYRHIGRIAEAEDALNSVLEAYPESALASYAALELAGLYREREENPAQLMDLYGLAAENPATPQVGAEALFLLGEAAYAQGAYSESARAYQQLLDTYPDEQRALESRLPAAWAFHNAGRFADGLRVAEQALKTEPDADETAEWLYIKANCLRRLLRADDARRTYLRITREYPRHELAPLASYETALISFRQRDFEDAVRQASAIEPVEGIKQDLYWLLAESYAEIGSYDDAVQNYYSIIDSVPESDRAVKARYRLAGLLQNRGDYLEASRYYRELADLHPEHELAPPSLFASAYCMAGKELFEEALKDWESVLTSYPDHPLAEESMIQKALTLQEVDRADEALHALAAFIKTYPESDFGAEARYRKGVLLKQDDRVTDAVQEFRYALALDPEDELEGRIRLRLALSLQQREEWGEAADLLAGLLGTPSRNIIPAEILKWLAHYQLGAGAYDSGIAAAELLAETGNTPAWRQIGRSLEGQGYMMINRRDEAIASFELGLEEKARTREGAEAALHVGALEREAGNYDRAHAHYQRAAEMASDPEMADIRARGYFGLGRVASGREDWASAARYYMSVGILYDDTELTPESLYRAAEAFGYIGRDNESEKTINELIDRYPDSEWSDKIRKQRNR